MNQAYRQPKNLQLLPSCKKNNIFWIAVLQKNCYKLIQFCVEFRFRALRTKACCLGQTLIYRTLAMTKRKPKKCDLWLQNRADNKIGIHVLIFYHLQAFKDSLLTRSMSHCAAQASHNFFSGSLKLLPLFGSSPGQFTTLAKAAC